MYTADRAKAVSGLQYGMKNNMLLALEGQGPVDWIRLKATSARALDANHPNPGHHRPTQRERPLITAVSHQVNCSRQEISPPLQLPYEI